MTTIFLDFETFYSQEYSLKKMSTEAYIRDPQFKAHGCVVTVDDEVPIWIPHARLRDALHQYAEDFPDAEWVAHNAQFDMAILAWHYDVHPRVIRDTLSMARIANYHGKHSLDALSQQYGLGKKGDALVKTLGVRDLDPLLEQQLATYCVQDVELLRGLYKRLSEDLQSALGAVRYARELELIDLTVRMFTEPLLEVNAELLHTRLQELEAERAAALQSAGVHEDVLMSNQQFASVLVSHGVQVPATFRKTDSDFLELLDHPVVGALVKGRLAAKSVSELRRTEKFIKVAARGTMPVPLKYHGAHTGRWSGSDGLNMQNLNRGSALRRCLQAPEGHVLVVVDSSQIEPKALAWFADAHTRLEQFRDGVDVYNAQASYILGRPVDRKNNPDDAVAGMVGKAVVIGCGYGMGHLMFAVHMQAGFLGMPSVVFDEDFCSSLGTSVEYYMSWLSLQRDDVRVRTMTLRPALLTREQWLTHLASAKFVIDASRLSVPEIPVFWRLVGKMLLCAANGDEIDFGHGLRTTKNKIVLPSGRALHYPNLRMVKDGFLYGADVKLSPTKATENIVQALTRDIVADQMLVISRKYRVVTMTHDEIVFLAHEDEAEDAFGFAQAVMRASPRYAHGLPLSSSGGWAKEYSK